VNPFRSGTGRHREYRHRGNRHRESRHREQRTKVVLASTGFFVLATATASALSGAGAVQAAVATPAVESPDDEDSGPADRPRTGHTVGLLVVDNSSADSWLEVDRTLNTLIHSKGTAGSDHDGGGGAIEVHSRDVSGSDPVAVGHPPWQSESGD
jgi:hypothetical protein